MSPTHREPPTQPESPDRSAWNIVVIFATLIVLTIAMAVLSRGLVTGSFREPTAVEKSAGR